MKQRINRKSPLADTAFEILEESLANAIPGGAARYHQERSLRKWMRLLCLLCLASLVAAFGLLPYWPAAGLTLAFAVFAAIVGSKSESYARVQRQIKQSRAALAAAEKEELVYALGSWGHSLEQLLVTFNGAANSAVFRRELVEKSIKASDQKASLRLKKILGDLMRWGRLVEEHRRLEACGGKTSRWDSPVEWPGEKLRRTYVDGSSFGKPILAGT